MIEAASSRIGLYEINRPTEAMVQLGNVIKDGTRLLREAVGMIRNMKQANGSSGSPSSPPPRERGRRPHETMRLRRSSIRRIP